MSIPRGIPAEQVTFDHPETETGPEYIAIGEIPAGLAYDLVADEYDSTYQSPLELAENRVIAQLVEPFTRGATIDMGAGTGLLLELVEIPPELYLGLDLSPRMVELAGRKFPNHRFDVADLGDRWPTWWVDHVVSLFGSMSYADAPAVVEQMASALRPGSGTFLVMLYQRPHASKILDARGLHVRQRVDSPQSALELFSGPEWVDVRVRGFSGIRLPWAGWLGLETATLTRWQPRLGHYLIVTGRRSRE